MNKQHRDLRRMHVKSGFICANCKYFHPEYRDERTGLMMGTCCGECSAHHEQGFCYRFMQKEGKECSE